MIIFKHLNPGFNRKFCKVNIANVEIAIFHFYFWFSCFTQHPSSSSLGSFLAVPSGARWAMLLTLPVFGFHAVAD